VPPSDPRRVDDRDAALLVERLRAGLWLLLFGVVVFFLADWVVQPNGRPAGLVAINVVELAVLGFAWGVLRRPVRRRAVVRTAMLVVVVFALTTALSGVMTRDADTSPILLIAFGMFTGTLFPWGVRAQVLTQAVIALAILGNVHAVQGLNHALLVPPAVLLASLASVYAAHALERQRRARRRRDEARAAAEARAHQAEVEQAARLSALGGMAAGLAHELNQPLAAIVSYARGCARRIESGEASVAALLPAIEAIAAQALRAGEVLRQIRSFLQNGALRREALDVNRLVREAARVAEADAERLGVRLVLDLGTGLPPAEADGIQVEQVLANLVRNGLEAIEARAAGPRVLTIATRQADGDALEVAVHDTGTGLTPSVARRLFDPFFTTKAEGLGLGLSISRTLVEANGGRLWAGGNDDGGATFRFTLPRVHARRSAA
jgi:C4-dicarboxylate-specific signal transduction histidine kinase